MSARTTTFTTAAAFACTFLTFSGASASDRSDLDYTSERPNVTESLPPQTTKRTPAPTETNVFGSDQVQRTPASERPRTITPIDLPNPGPIGDYNGDFNVDILDLTYFLEGYFAGAPRADVNGDGKIDNMDIIEALNAVTYSDQ